MRPKGDQYFAPSDEANTPSREVWHWVLGLFLVIGGVFLLGVAAYLVFYFASPTDWQGLKEDGPRGAYADHLALFGSFLPMFLVPFLIWRFLNRMPFKRLIQFGASIRWGHMTRAALVIMGIYAIGTLIEFQINPSEFDGLSRQTDWSGWLILTVIVLLLCPIQAAGEEIFVRGYGNYSLVRIPAALRLSPAVAIWIAYLTTSLLFAWLHAANPEGEGQFWPYMASMTLYGLGMCVLLHVEGGLESAIGYHIANNIFVFSIFGYADPYLPNSALFWLPEIEIDWLDLIEDTLWMMVFITLILLWNRRSERRYAPDLLSDHSP